MPHHHPNSLANLIPYVPGQSGNPKGIQSAGRLLSDTFNYFATSDLTEDDLRRIVKDKSLGWTRRTAALRVLRSMESGDMSDFEPVIDGDLSLRALKSQGVNTEIVKKIKKKRRVMTAPDGSRVEDTEREIELHDRSGVDFDRVSDRTEGKPAQTVNVNNSAPPMIVVFGAEPPPRPQLVGESPQ